MFSAQIAEAEADLNTRVEDLYSVTEEERALYLKTISFYLG